MKFACKEIEKVECKTTGTQYSTFFLNINTNRRTDKMSEQEVNRFKTIIRYLCSKENILNYINDHNEPGGCTGLFIDKIDIEYVFETVSQKGLLHSHIKVETEHRHALASHVNIDLKKLRSLLNQLYGYNLHVDVKVTNNPLAQLADYMNK